MIRLPALAIISAGIIGDASTAALIAGSFTVFNSFMIVRLSRDHRSLKRAITADRKIVYDADGRPVGTVLDLRGDDEWTEWARLATRRRHDDQPPIDAEIP